MTTPSGVWLFSSKAARMRGKARALPLSVWAIWGLSDPLRNHSFIRLAWKVSKLETLLTSSHFC